MKRSIRIASGCCMAASLLLVLSSCATSPRRLVTLESARRSLQMDYPSILESFDLHQGNFTVSGAGWDTLPAPDRILFLQRCSQARQDVINSMSVVVRGDDRVLATYDGVAPVFFRSPFPVVGGSETASDLGGNEPGPVLVAMPRPVYPKPAIEAGVEGTVYVKVLVGTDGQVSEAHVVGDGIPVLNGAAVAAASQARFQAATENGQPIAAWVQMPLRFSIMGKRGAPVVQPGAPNGAGLTGSISRISTQEPSILLDSKPVKN